MSVLSSRRPAALLFLVVMVLALVGAALTAPARASTARQSPVPAHQAAGPRLFIGNAGQWPGAARFQLWGAGAGPVWFTDDGLWLSPGESSGPIHFTFAGAGPEVTLEPFNPLETVVSYFLGSDPASWQPAVPVWGGLRYTGVYPGVDLELWSVEDRVECRTVGPEAAPASQAALEVPAGASAVMVQPDQIAALCGLLNDSVTAPAAAAPEGSGLAYSTFAGGGQNFGVAVDAAGSAYITGWVYGDFPANGFEPAAPGGNNAFVAKLNAAGTALHYAAFIGGSTTDIGQGVAVDATGAAYVTGWTWSRDFPTTGGAFQGSHRGGVCTLVDQIPCADAFIFKLTPDGRGLAYATLLGGGRYDVGKDIKVDAAGAAYVVGYTYSYDFPVAGAAFQTSYKGGNGDAFVTKVNPAGSALVYSTYLGGSDIECNDRDDAVYPQFCRLAIDPAGAAYVTGYTRSKDFPITPNNFSRFDGYAFVSKLQPNGALAYSTYFAGSYVGDTLTRGIAADDQGSAYITGYSSSLALGTGGAYQQYPKGGRDAFVAKIDPSGKNLVYSTYLGGTDDDEGYDIAVDRAGEAYVVGITSANDFPTTADAYRRTRSSLSDDLFVARLGAGGNGLGYATLLGGYATGFARSWSIAAGPGRSAVVTGETSDPAFPTTAGAFRRQFRGSQDVFVTKLLMGDTVIPAPTPTPTRTPTPTPKPDLRVMRIEVGQVFVEQKDPISKTPIPLIAGKDTLVRVYVGVSGAAAVDGVTASLRIRQANGTETIDARPVGAGVVRAKSTPDPFTLRDTINFRPAPGLLKGNVTFSAVVDPQNRIPETNEGNNTGGTTPAAFQSGKKLRVAWTRFGYVSPALPPLALPDWETAAKGDAVLRQIYPVAPDDVEYFYQPGLPVVLATKFSDNKALYIKNANRFWDDVSVLGWRGGTPDRLFAWLPGVARDPGTVCGTSDPVWEPQSAAPGRVAVGADKCDKWFDGALQEVGADVMMAHELGHTLNNDGLRHTANDPGPHCFATPEGTGPYPTATPRGSIIAHGLDVLGLRILDPLDTYDFMTYCKPRWASPFNYFRLAGGFAPASAAAAEEVAAPAAATRLLLASGLVYSPTLRVEFDPFYSVLTTAAASPNPGGDFCLEGQSATGAKLASRCFTLSFSSAESSLGAPEAAEAGGGFALRLPYPNGVTKIVLTRRGAVLATRPVSAHAPSVRLLSPNGGEVWAGSGSQRVTWTAGDADGDALHFSLAYSTDGGGTWIPAGTDLTGTQHELDVSLLPGGRSVLLRVGATDGVNTTYDVSDAAFEVGRKAPFAFILSPESGSGILPGRTVRLRGRAFDLEDATLSEMAFRWSSDRDGPLGAGRVLDVTLSPGAHTITLTVTDANGQASSASIRISAGHVQFLPAVRRGG